MGGIFAARWLHRAVGIAFTVLVVAHLSVAITGVLRGWMKGTMLLGRRDFRDAIDNLRYYAGDTATPPKFGRFDYRQKFEYWGLIFGSIIMVATGFILFFPIATANVLPAQLIPAAKVIHSYEALFRSAGSHAATTTPSSSTSMICIVGPGARPCSDVVSADPVTRISATRYMSRPLRLNG